MSVIAKRMDAIIRAELAPMLKKAGFKKQARNFRREHPDHTDIINAQASRHNDGHLEGEFKVNLGVYYPVIAEIAEMLPVHGAPKEYDRTMRATLGILDDDRDYWWKIDPLSSDAETATDLANAVEKVGLPWLERMSDLNQAKQRADEEYRSRIAASVALFQGDRDDAQMYLDKSMAKSHPSALPRLVAWAEKHGLSIITEGR